MAPPPDRRKSQTAHRTGELFIPTRRNAERLRKTSDGGSQLSTDDTLSAAHLASLQDESGISPGVISERGYRTITVKAQSKAYFQILGRHPEARKVFQLGNQIRWVLPGQRILLVNMNTGKDALTEAELDQLFPRKR